jgi:hypothetical protein
MDHRPDLVDKGGEIWVVKINHHNHFIARTAGVFRGPAFTINNASHPSKDGLKICQIIIISVTPGTDGHQQVAGFCLSGCILIHQETRNEPYRFVPNR